MADLLKFTKGALAATAITKIATGSVSKLSSAFRGMRGGISKVIGGMTKFAQSTDMATGAGDAATGMLSGLGSVGSVATSALMAVAAAIAFTVTGLIALAAAAIAVVETRAKLLSTFTALGGGAAQGAATLAMVDRLAAALPFTTAQIGAMAVSLQSAGFQGKALESAVSAVAAATALMGEQGGAAAGKMLKQLAEGGGASKKMLKAIQEGSPKSARLLADMGLRIEDVAAAAGMSVAAFKKSEIGAEGMANAVEKALAKKGKGPLEEMGKTFPAMFAKLKDGIGGLFEGLGPSVKPFMAAVQELFGQFSKGGGAFKALKPIVTSVLGAVFKYATMAVSAVSQFVKSMASGKSSSSTWTTIKSAIATVVAALKIAGGLVLKVFSNATVLNGLKVVFLVIAVAIGAVIGAVLAVVAAFAALAAGVVALGAYLWGLAAEVLESVGGWASGAIDAANNFIGGLVSGITAGASRVVAAVKGMASNALGAFTSLLGIHSDSAVMKKMGGHFTGGLETGIDRGAPDVSDSAAKLGSNATAGAARGMSSGGGNNSGTSKGSLSIGELHLHTSAPTTQSMAEELFASFVERLAASQGV